jgi:hypothetical protein
MVGEHGIGVGVGQAPPGQGVEVAVGEDVDVGVCVGPGLMFTWPLYATALIGSPNGSTKEGSSTRSVT